MLMISKNIRIYNTLSGKKELLKPLKGKKINLFVCGPTVYDFAHIGHARTDVIFDCFAKYLKYLGFDVFYLQNITDVDDKIIAKAREKGVAPKDLAVAFEVEHLKDMKLLGITSVKKYARATDYIPQIISQVQRLAEKGFAYRLDDGMYFDIGKFKNYGKLSGRTSLEAEDAVSRIDYSQNKKNRGDFCVWKFNEGSDGAALSTDRASLAPEKGREPSWPSPFGQGRPGWHIEDTAITETFFGAQYDIHGGGRDLMFPHHEAEISLMETISGKKPLARYWMHTGFLTINEQKMSKSLNNSVVISAFLKRYSVQQLRFWIAKNLWRSPMNYSDATMLEIRSALEKIEEFLRKLKGLKVKGKISPVNVKKYTGAFWKALADDFNTPKAFAVIFDMIKAANTALDKNALGRKDASSMYDFFMAINKIFNIIDTKKLKGPQVPAEVKKLVQDRQLARKNQEWALSDQLRLEIEKYGYIIQDSPSGPIIKKM